MSTTQSQATTVYRRDYQPYPFELLTVELFFDLQPQHTIVKSKLHFKAKQAQACDLVLNGENIELQSIHCNQQALGTEQYDLQGDLLTITAMQGEFVLEICNSCNPSTNSNLMGLYISQGQFFTQCEAEGFRRITFFPDRPDVMSIYTVTMQADKAQFPYLLSNGNLVSQRELEHGRHEAVWHDPFAKPSYLFALVAGDFDVRETTTQTKSGKEVLLQVYTDKGSGKQSLWALQSLERALKWDEKRFNLELDLDRFMIVAVRDFNMGAMENKGLNIFNAAYVLATPETSTDQNFIGVEDVIGHEYFHNWSGNRVTCRDWFQLSLKEGLTVFREQEFSADIRARGLDDTAAQSARAVKRIEDVNLLRMAQFPEDASPMAHPIRPDSYEEIGNFYTATVYEKGAEVIRMQHTLLGEAGFQQGIANYFHTFDGQAVTCDDFLETMQAVYKEQHPGKDLAVFRHWYSQAGTPRVEVTLNYDKAAQTCEITLQQSCDLVGVEKRRQDFHKQPFHIPFKLGLLDAQGQALSFELAGQTQQEVLLELKQAQETWTLNAVKSAPIPSLLRDFSAPVVVEYDYSDSDLAVLASHDSNHFTRWQALQELLTSTTLALAEEFASDSANPDSHSIKPEIFRIWQATLQDQQLDPAYKACLLSLPSLRILLEQMRQADPQALVAAHQLLQQTLAKQFSQAYWAILQAHEPERAYSPDPISVGKRRLRQQALKMLMSIEHPEAQVYSQTLFKNHNNMTDGITALSAITDYGPEDVRSHALARFFEHWQHDALVIDKWFAIQASSPSVSLAQAEALMAHPAFNIRNPNRARSLLFQFCMNNMQNFHHKNGEGYEFWADQVLYLNQINPEVAARLARCLDNWKRYAQPYRDAMHKAIQRVASANNLSRNVHEIISKALEIYIYSKETICLRKRSHNF
ncbi:aminopeptidase N [Brackiella oedipodis]|uniref:aminopeptidase N n=1 Tax=Brackiella oedipodis TaxID=124225 RepID=UPI0006868C86|nr:aminopeptidase N [Brackiella oedipodis]